MGILGGDKPVQKSQTVPWDPAQKYLKFGMGQAQKLYQSGAGFQTPKFQTWNPFSSQTNQALSGMWNTAQGGNPLAGQSMDAISGILGGTPGSNPAFEAMLNDQSQQTANDVQRQFSGLGRIGSGADIGVLTDRIGALRNTAMANQYNTDIGQRLQAIQAAPGAYQQQFLPYQEQAQVGQAYDTQNQQRLQSRIDKFNSITQAPWNRLNAYNGAIGGGSSAGSTTTTSQPSNPLGGILGGALGGGSLFGIPGAIGGGILGLLGSL